jgi:tetratricopeptide (TPR) repeat protein
MLPQPLAADLGPAAIETPLRIWSILIAQAADDRELALARWAQIQFPRETEVWRYVAIAAANLQQFRLVEAAAALDVAEQLDPHNPLVRYYTGLHLLERAEAARDWADAVAIFDVRLVAFDSQGSPTTPWIMPNSASMFRLAAIQELEAAIAHQSEVDLSQPLVTATTVEERHDLPTVHDLLLACGGDRFVADAHSIVSYLYLERGNADAAEQHLDSATARGASVIYGYDDVARAYEMQSRYLSAARAAAKSVQHGPGRAGAAVRLFKDLGRAIQEGQGS